MYTYSFLGLVLQLTNLIAASSHLIKGDLFLSSASLILFPNLAFSTSLTLHAFQFNRGYRSPDALHQILCFFFILIAGSQTIRATIGAQPGAGAKDRYEQK